MKMIRLISPVLLFCLFSATAAYAGSDSNKSAIHQITIIMQNLNHHPSSDEKKDLQKIIRDESISDNVRSLATTVLNLDHKATQADKAKMVTIANDEKASEHVRTIASILSNLNHKPSQSDKEKLNQIQQSVR